MIPPSPPRSLRWSTSSIWTKPIHPRSAAGSAREDLSDLKIFHGKVGMTFDDPAITPKKPSMVHFFYMDEADPSKVSRWIGAVGPVRSEDIPRQGRNDVR